MRGGGHAQGVCAVLFEGIHRTISDLLYQWAKKCGVQTCLHGQWRDIDKFFSKGMNVKELVFYRQTESKRQLHWKTFAIQLDWNHMLCWQRNLRKKVKPKGHLEERWAGIDDSLNRGDKGQVRSQLRMVVWSTLVWGDGILSTWASAKVS